MDIPTISKPCCWYCRYNSTSHGVSTRQGAHQVAQKFRTTALPRKSDRFSVRPSGVLSSNGGATLACELSRLLAADGAGAERGAVGWTRRSNDSKNARTVITKIVLRYI